MAKACIDRIDRDLARRLVEARREIGVSTRAVAAGLPPGFSVSHATIASYEKGTTVPPLYLLAALAQFYGRSLNWFLGERTGLTDLRYRNLPNRVRVQDKRHFEALAERWVGAYVGLESRLDTKLSCREPHFFDPELTPEELARRARKSLGIDEGSALQNVVEMLETFAVRVMELRTVLSVDTLTAQHNNMPVLIINPAIASERMRLILATEIARSLFARYAASICRSEEILDRFSNDFAAEFLLPISQLQKAFEGRSFLRLISFKERFGVTLASMIFRAAQKKIIASSLAKKLWREISVKGWRNNEPGAIWKDRAIRFETLLETAIQTGALTWDEAERATGVCSSELIRRIQEITDDFGIINFNANGEKGAPHRLKIAKADGESDLTQS
ncbi:helix-turn-helix domain-containing protein [Planctopirus hydrillae]|uniref:HTH cro/C1-type domain-containing protein n=1 Tax=Planctopirus hydrillae TaxID=1841610 RepID=A0A1C3EB92_9PLAN|nr:XRE family transcriptional regulator [Planctopirus hydrillae]ODA30521.1 hypothetical protein A6X21_05680 [Planctopirus hydrillae]